MSMINGNGTTPVQTEITLPPNVIMHDVVDSLSTGMNLLQLNLLTQEMPDSLQKDLSKVIGYMKKMSKDLETLAQIISP